MELETNYQVDKIMKKVKLVGRIIEKQNTREAVLMCSFTTS